jgi:hypothetical protein
MEGQPAVSTTTTAIISTDTKTISSMQERRER